MAYENYALALSAVSSLVLLFGLYNTYLLSKTRRAYGIWSLVTLSFLTLLLYQVAEVAEYSGEVLGLESLKELKELAEGFAHTMPLISSLIFMHLSIVIRGLLMAGKGKKGGV